MQYPTMTAAADRRFAVPRLDGGVNLHRPPHRIDDNQLADCRNLWWKEGLLCTRPGLDSEDGDEWAFAKGVARVADIHPLPKAEGFHNGVRLVYTAYLVDSKDEDCTFLRVRRQFEGGGYDMLPELRFGTGGVEGIRPNSGLLIPVEDGRLYVFTNFGGIFLQVFGENEWRDLSDGGYIPTILVNGPSAPALGDIPKHSGVKYESRNRIQPAYRVLYTTNGEDTVFFLPDQYITAALRVSYRDQDGNFYIHELAVGQTAEETFGEDGLKLHLESVAGVFRFTKQGESGEEPGAPAASGRSGNMTATVKPDRKSPMVDQSLFAMTFCTWFGGDRSGRVGGARLFLSGNWLQPNLVYWSEANDPLYFPEDNAAWVGDANNAVTAFGRQDDVLVIFKKNEIYYADYQAGDVVQLSDLINEPAMNAATDRARFPITQLHTRIGCDCPDTVRLCSNRLIWACSNGEVYGLMGADRYTERSVCMLSGAVRPLLAAMDKDTLQEAFACTLDQQYLLFAGDTVLALDTLHTAFQGYMVRTDERFSDEGLVWHIWAHPVPGLCAAAQTGDQPMLFSRLTRQNDAGTIDGWECTYSFSPSLGVDRPAALDGTGRIVRTETPILSRFCTRSFAFDAPERLKLVRRLYVGIRDTAEGEIRVTYLADGEPVEDGYPLTLTGTGQLRQYRLSPGIGRIDTFALALETAAPLAMDGLTMTVTLLGEAKG